MTPHQNVARLEQLVLNAPTLAGAQRYHKQLDKARESLPPAEREQSKSSEYRLGYQAGWMAGRASALAAQPGTRAEGGTGR